MKINKLKKIMKWPFLIYVYILFHVAFTKRPATIMYGYTLNTLNTLDTLDTLDTFMALIFKTLSHGVIIKILIVH